MTWDGTKPSISQGSLALAFASIRENLAALYNGDINFGKLDTLGNLTAGYATFTRIVADGANSVNAVAEIGVRSSAYAVGQGASLIFFSDDNDDLTNAIQLPNGAGRHSYMGRVSVAFSDITLNAEKTELYFQIRTASAYATDLILKGNDGGVTIYRDSIRSGAEVGEVGVTWQSGGAGQLNGYYQQFRHTRASVPTVTLSATTSGLTDLLVTSVAADGITIMGFRFYQTASAAGAARAFRKYTTSA